jgi:hypothetical protein
MKRERQVWHNILSLPKWAQASIIRLNERLSVLRERTARDAEIISKIEGAEILLSLNFDDHQTFYVPEGKEIRPKFSVPAGSTVIVYVRQ